MTALDDDREKFEVETTWQVIICMFVHTNDQETKLQIPLLNKALTI